MTARVQGDGRCKTDGSAMLSDPNIASDRRRRRRHRRRRRQRFLSERLRSGEHYCMARRRGRPWEGGVA